MKDLRKILGDMSPEERRWLLGNETSNGMLAFDHKRVVHAGLNGRPIMDQEEQQKVWQEHMNEEFTGGVRSAYIHIPFCEKKCSYCGFFQNASQEKVLERYTDLLIEEIKTTAQYKRAQTGTINTVYFGGGTPSTLAAKDIERLVKTVREELPLANDCEITLESRIHDMDEERIEAALRGGVNRFSLGVQSFDTKIRQAVGRIDDEKTVIERLQKLMSYDSATVVIDLMFGLPYQTWETWLRDLEIQFDLGLHGGDMYQLNVFPDSDLAKHIERGRVAACMPTEEQARLYVQTVEHIKNNHPEITLFDPSHWAADRRERNMYNAAAKRRADMLCFGSSSGGRLGNIQMMQHRNLNAYVEAMENGLKPIAMMIDDGGMSKLAGDLKMQLEDSYLDGKYFKRHWNKDITGYLAPIIEAWVMKGLVTYSNDVMRFTPVGMFWHDNLIQAVLEAVKLGTEEGVSRLRQEKIAHQDTHAEKAKSSKGMVCPHTGMTLEKLKEMQARGEKVNLPKGHHIIADEDGTILAKPEEDKAEKAESSKGMVCPHTGMTLEKLKEMQARGEKVNLPKGHHVIADEDGTILAKPEEEASVEEVAETPAEENKPKKRRLTCPHTGFSIEIEEGAPLPKLPKKAMGGILGGMFKKMTKKSSDDTYKTGPMKADEDAE